MPLCGPIFQAEGRPSPKRFWKGFRVSRPYLATGTPCNTAKHLQAKGGDLCSLLPPVGFRVATEIKRKRQAQEPL